MWGIISMLPVIFVNAAPIKAMDAFSWVAVISAVLGLVTETAADTQKDKYRSNPKNDGHWCDVGIWKYCRHPNCMHFNKALFCFVLMPILVIFYRFWGNANLVVALPFGFSCDDGDRKSCF